MKYTLNRQEVEQLLNNFKDSISKLEINLAKGLNFDHKDPKLVVILDSLTYLRIVSHRLETALIYPRSQEYDMNYGMYLEIEKAKKMQKNLTKILTNY